MIDNASDTAQASAAGTVEEIDGKYRLRFERRLAHPVERVWAALTQPEELIGWLARAEVDLVEGGRFDLEWQNPVSAEQASKYGIEGVEPGETAVVPGTVARLEAPRLLEVHSEAHGLLRWELREAGPGCVLVFTNETPAPEEYLAQVLGGWHIHLDLLEEALVGNPADWPNWPIEAWAEHRDRYAARLG